MNNDIEYTIKAGAGAFGSVRKPSKSRTPLIDRTERGVCLVCGRKIHFVGKYWLHTNGRNYSHIPTPMVTP